MEKMYKIKYHLEVKSDFLKINDDVLKEVLDYIKKFKTDPYKYSSKLYNQNNMNLSGYRKTYICNAKYRIISKIEDGVLNIVEIIAVGERKNLSVYKEAFKRICKE